MKLSKEIKILISCVAITLIFLFSYNVVYAYFSSKKSSSGEGQLGYMEVKFAYSVNNQPTIVEEDEYYIYSANTPLFSRGDIVPFTNQDGEALNLMFYSPLTSCASYVRFWVDAFILDENELPDKMVNYGQYFVLQGTTFTRQIKTVEGVTNAVHYLTNALEPQGTNVYLNVSNSLQISNNAPNDLLSTKVLIVVRFEACQQANEAFKAEFNDGWGYLSTWE